MWKFAGPISLLCGVIVASMLRLLDLPDRWRTVRRDLTRAPAPAPMRSSPVAAMTRATLLIAVALVGLPARRTTYAYHGKSSRWRGVTINSLANRRWRDLTRIGDEVVVVEHGELFGDRTGFNRLTCSMPTREGFECRLETSADSVVWKSGGYGLRAVVGK